MKRFALMKFNMDGGGGGGEQTSAPVTPAVTTPTAPTQPQGSPMVGTNPLLDPNWAPAQQGATPTVEQLDFAGRKVPVTDPIIKDIHKDYSHLQKTFQETNQTVKSLQEQNQVYMQMIQQFQSQQAPAAPQQPQGPTAEEMESFSQEYMDKFYENPVEANKMLFESPYMQDVINQRVQNAVNQVLGPMQQKEQFNNEVQSMSQKYPDFNSHIDAMQAVIDQNPKLAELGLETVYMVAKGQNTRPTNVESLLQDPAFKQSLMGNEQFKNEVINAYMQSRSQSNQQIPPVMGNQPGGSTPTIPEQKPKSIGEASKMFTRFLNGF